MPLHSSASTQSIRVAAARKIVLQQIQEGVFVLDLKGRIVDLNPMAAAILGSQETKLLGKPVAEVIPIDAEIPGRLDIAGIDQTDMVIERNGSAREYSLNLTPLRGQNGELIGQLLLLHNVTEQKQAQNRLLEQKSVVATLQERERLARELHDGIGQTLGYVGIQAQTALKWIHSGSTEKAETILERLAEVAKEAHTDIRESILSLRINSNQEWSFISTLRKFLDRYQVNYGIQTELSLPKGLVEETFDSGPRWDALPAP